MTTSARKKELLEKLKGQQASDKNALDLKLLLKYHKEI